MYICLCKSVTERDIQEAVDMGLVSYDSVQSALSVGTGCGTCAYEVDNVIQDKLAQNLNIQAGPAATTQEIKF